MDEEIRVSGSWDGDLEAALARLDRRLERIEDRFEDAGRAGERAGDQISEGADEAAEGLQRTEEAAEGVADSLEDVQRRAERGARALAEADRRAVAAARAMRGLGEGAEAAEEALEDVEEAAEDAGRALDEAGDEAAESGAQAAAASRGWGRLTAAIERNERAARMWERTQALFRWDTYRSQVDRYRQSWERMSAFDWQGASKKVGGFAQKLGGAGRAWSIFIGAIKLAVLYTAIGLISSLAAGAASAATELAGLGRAIGAVIPLVVAAKLGMLAWTAAAEALAPELDAIKKRFEGIGEAVARGGLRKGLQILNRDMGEFVDITYKGFANIGRALGSGAERLGMVAKNGERLRSVERIFAGMDDILDRLIGTVLHLGESLLIFTDAGVPSAIMLAGSMERVTQRFRDFLAEANRSGRLTAWINAGFFQLYNTVLTVTDFMVGLYNIFKISSEVSGGFGDRIMRLAQNFRDWTESVKGENAIRKYFEDAMPAFNETILLLRDFFGMLLQIPAAEGTAPLINQLRTEFFPAIGEAIAQISGQGGLLPAILSAGTELAKMFTQLDLTALTVIAQGFADLVAGLTHLIATVPGLGMLVSAFAVFWVVGGAVLSVISSLAAAWGWVAAATAMTGELTIAQRIFGTVLGNIRLGLALLRLQILAATGATSLWGAAMYLATLPITWIIIAIVALVAAFIWAYNNVDWFREGVHAVLNAVGGFFIWLWQDVIVPAWNGIVEAITTAWNDYIFPVLDTIWYVLKFIGAIIFTVLVAPFVIAWNILSALIMAAWEVAIKPVLDWIGSGFEFLAMLVGVAIAIFQEHMRVAGIAVSELWALYVQPVIDFFVDGWNWLMTMIGIGVAIFTDMMNRTGGSISYLWTTYVSPILDWIGDKWAVMAEGFRIVKEAVLDPMFDGMGSKLGILQDWFRGAVETIGIIWDGMKRKLAVPINFLIRTVWNDGVLKVWNWVAEKLGLPVGRPVAEIPEYATGGPIRGPGTGRSDSIVAAVSNGEHVWTAEEVRRAGGHRRVQQMRKVAMRGGATAVQNFLAYGGESLRAFAEGGAVERGQGWARGEAGKPYGWGQVGPSSYDCSGFISALTNFVTNRPVHRRLFATGSFSRNRGAGGFVPGLGSAFAIGVNPKVGNGPGHMAGTIGGMNVESSGGKGVSVGSNARGADDSLFPWQFSLPQVGGNFTSGGGGGWTWDIAKAALDAIINPIIAGIPFRGPPQWMDIPRRMAETGRDNLYAWARDKLEAVMSFFGGGQAGMGDAAVRTAVQQMAARFGWGDGAEWDALDRLIQGESSWNPNARNPRSSAAGLFQKMQSIHGPVEPSVAGQAAWGLNYIKGKYGTPSAAYRAWSSRSPHWYDDGGYLEPGLNLVANGTGHPEPVFTTPQWGMISGILDSTADSLAPQAAGHVEYHTDPALLDAMENLAAAVARRPPDVSTIRDDVRREVSAAIRQQTRESNLRTRYSYG